MRQVRKIMGFFDRFRKKKEESAKEESAKEESAKEESAKEE